MATDPKKIVSFKDLYAAQRAREGAEPQTPSEETTSEQTTTAPNETTRQEPSEPQSLEGGPQRSQPQPSRLPEPPLAGYGSRLQSDRPQRSQPQSSQPQRSQPQRSQLDLMAALPEVEGHTEMPHQVVDHLYPNLDPYEQAAFTQLYRLSWGYNRNTCRISNDRLAGRSGMSVAKLKQVTRLLEGKGLIKKVGSPHGQNVIQGVEYEVLAPSWQLRRSQPQHSQPQSSRLQHAPNKDKELKEIEKAAVDCPDCHGTGMWYPDGYAKGVARCMHKRLKEK